MTLAAVTNGPRALDVVVIWSRIGVSLGQWKWAIQENADFTHDSDNRSLFKKICTDQLSNNSKRFLHKYLCNYQNNKIYVLTDTHREEAPKYYLEHVLSVA